MLYQRENQEENDADRTVQRALNLGAKAYGSNISSVSRWPRHTIWPHTYTMAMMTRGAWMGGKIWAELDPCFCFFRGDTHQATAG